MAAKRTTVSTETAGANGAGGAPVDDVKAVEQQNVAAAVATETPAAPDGAAAPEALANGAAVADGGAPETPADGGAGVVAESVADADGYAFPVTLDVTNNMPIGLVLRNLTIEARETQAVEFASRDAIEHLQSQADHLAETFGYTQPITFKELEQ